MAVTLCCMEPTELHSLRLAVAAVLRAERARADVTQDQLVEMSGLSKSTIVRLEAGRRDADLSQLSAISEVLKIDLAYLVSEISKTTKANIPPGALAALDQLDSQAKEGEDQQS